ncbi:MAG: GTP-binding protein, partial [Phycisphaeraceae bacterium]
MTAREAIPLTVIGGYLGAGKTTLLNQLLRHNAGRRLAVVVNDFGSINIDAALIAQHDGETMSLANGCICCSLANGFLTVLTQLKDRPDPPEHIIVEASGVADPLKIAQYGHLPGFCLDGVIVLADAETVRRRSRDKYVGRTVIRQLRGADLLVLTKPDLVTDDDREA